MRELGFHRANRMVRSDILHDPKLRNGVGGDAIVGNDDRRSHSVGVPVTRPLTPSRRRALGRPSDGAIDGQVDKPVRGVGMHEVELHPESWRDLPGGCLRRPKINLDLHSS